MVLLKKNKIMRNLCIIMIFVSINAITCKESNSDDAIDIIPDSKALVTKVSVSGEEGDYTFSVEIKSPDLGCEQYANWWEVISEDKKLIYRRILGHSHVNEQPFVRSGGAIEITKDQIVYIRVHMNTNGYSEYTLKGNVSQGFEQYIVETGFASDLALIDPLPGECAF